MIYLILFIVIIALGMGYQKFRGNQALTFVYVDISGVTLDQIVAVGTKASGSLAGRMLKASPPSVKQTAGGVEWHTQIKGSVMSYSVKPLPGGTGFRVGGAVTKMRIAQTTIGSDRGTWGLSKAISNAICRLLGIPHNAPQLVSRRKRVLAAVSGTGTVIGSPSPRVSAR